MPFRHCSRSVAGGAGENGGTQNVRLSAIRDVIESSVSPLAPELPSHRTCSSDQLVTWIRDRHPAPFAFSFPPSLAVWLVRSLGPFRPPGARLAFSCHRAHHLGCSPVVLHIPDRREPPRSGRGSSNPVSRTGSVVETSAYTRHLPIQPGPPRFRPFLPRSFRNFPLRPAAAAPDGGGLWVRAPLRPGPLEGAPPRNATPNVRRLCLPVRRY